MERGRDDILQSGLHHRGDSGGRGRHGPGRDRLLGMHVFHDSYGSDHSVYGTSQHPKAVAHMQPLVVDALVRRDHALARSNAWRRARHQGWQVLDENGAPVPEPAEVGENW